MSKIPLFPSSLELFRLVRTVADELGTSEKMSDAELGRMIGLESARTSRWKHGQIAVNDAARLLALSLSLGIDISVLSHVAAGYLSADEALELMSNEKEFVRFIGEQLLLPTNGQSMTLVSSDGSEARIARRTALKHERLFRRGSSSRRLTDDGRSVVVLLADDDDTTIDVFTNLSGEGTGIVGVVARSIPEALIVAGQLHPRLVILDLFMGQADGFAAVRSLTTNEATSATEVVATSLTMSPDVVRAAKGSGASEILERPLRSRPLGRLLRNLRSGR